MTTHALLSLFFVGTCLVETLADVAGYDVIFVAGQSNAVGNGWPYITWNQTTRIQMVIPWFSIVTAYDSTSAAGTNSTPGTGMNGFAIPVAQQHLAQNLDANRNILIVNCAVPGTAFHTGFWAPGGAGPSACIEYMTAAMAAGGGTNRLLMMLWLQGESDRTHYTTPQYAQQLSFLIQFWRGGALPGANSTTPFIAAPLANVCPTTQPTCNFTFGGPYNYDQNPDTPDKLAIQRALQNLAYYEPYADCISNAGTYGDSEASHEGSHYGTPSLIILGQRYYAMYLAIRNNSGNAYATKRAPAASIAGAMGFYEFNQTGLFMDSSPANVPTYCWSCNQYNASIIALLTNQMVYSTSRSSWVYQTPPSSESLAATPLLAFPFCQAANCTIAFWHQQSNVAAMNADYTLFSGAYALNTGNFYPNVLFHSGGTIIAGFTGPNPYGGLAAGSIPANYVTIDADWHHFVFQYSVNESNPSSTGSGILQIWQDGVNVGIPDYGWNFTAFPSISHFASISSALTVGWWPLNPSCSSFGAQYDDFAVFNRTLTNVEALALYLHSSTTLFVTPSPTSAAPTTAAPSGAPTTQSTSNPTRSPTSLAPTTAAPTRQPTYAVSDALNSMPGCIGAFGFDTTAPLDSTGLASSCTITIGNGQTNLSSSQCVYGTCMLLNESQISCVEPTSGWPTTESAAYTVAAWIAPFISPSFEGYPMFFNVLDAGGNSVQFGITSYAMVFPQSNYNVPQVTSNSQGLPYTSGAAYGFPFLTTGAWTHIAFVSTGGSVRIYINATLQSAVIDGAIQPIRQTPFTFNIGSKIGSNWGMLAFQGRIDELGVFNIALSQSQITDLYGVASLTASPTTSAPSNAPTAKPTTAPTSAPSVAPTTAASTSAPNTAVPTAASTNTPSTAPPSNNPSASPTRVPTTAAPTDVPSSSSSSTLEKMGDFFTDTTVLMVVFSILAFVVLAVLLRCLCVACNCCVHHSSLHTYTELPKVTTTRPESTLQ
jgi:hypothetical protein